jgi:hypothetical protein
MAHETDEDLQKIEEFREALPKVLQYEKTPCPFKPGYTEDVPETPQTPAKIKRTPTQRVKKWRKERGRVWAREDQEVAINDERPLDRRHTIGNIADISDGSLFSTSEEDDGSSVAETSTREQSPHVETSPAPAPAPARRVEQLKMPFEALAAENKPSLQPSPLQSSDIQEETESLFSYTPILGEGKSTEGKTNEKSIEEAADIKEEKTQSDETPDITECSSVAQEPSADASNDQPLHSTTTEKAHDEKVSFAEIPDSSELTAQKMNPEGPKVTDADEPSASGELPTVEEAPIPAETPAQDLAEASVKIPEEVLIENPTQATIDDQVVTPVETSVETLADVPAVSDASLVTEISETVEVPGIKENPVTEDSSAIENSSAADSSAVEKASNAASSPAADEASGNDAGPIADHAMTMAGDSTTAEVPKPTEVSVNLETPTAMETPAVMKTVTASETPSADDVQADAQLSPDTVPLADAEGTVSADTDASNIAEHSTLDESVSARADAIDLDTIHSTSQSPKALGIEITSTNPEERLKPELVRHDSPSFQDDVQSWISSSHADARKPDFEERQPTTAVRSDFESGIQDVPTPLPVDPPTSAAQDDTESVVSTADSFYSLSEIQSVSTSPPFQDAASFMEERGEHQDWPSEIQSRHHKRGVSELTVTPHSGGAALSPLSPGILSEDGRFASDPSTPTLVSDSEDVVDLALPDEDAPRETVRLRRLGTSGHRELSPLPPAATIFTPSPRVSKRNLTISLVKKTYEILMSPPGDLIQLMLEIAAHFAAKAKAMGPFQLGRRPRALPGSWDSDGEEEDDWGEDDYGIPLRGVESIRESEPMG